MIFDKNKVKKHLKAASTELIVIVEINVKIKVICGHGVKSVFDIMLVFHTSLNNPQLT